MYDHRPPLGLQFYLRILLYFSNILRLPLSTKAVSYLLRFLNMSNFPPLRSLLEMPSRHSLWRTQDSCTGTSSLSHRTVNLKRPRLSPSSHEMTSLFPAKASSTRPAASSQGADGPYALLKLRPFPPCFRLASLARTTVYGRPSPDSMSPSHPQPFQLPSQPELLHGATCTPCLRFLTSHGPPRSLHSGADHTPGAAPRCHPFLGPATALALSRSSFAGFNSREW